MSSAESIFGRMSAEVPIGVGFLNPYSRKVRLMHVTHMECLPFGRNLGGTTESSSLVRAKAFFIVRVNEKDEPFREKE